MTRLKKVSVTVLLFVLLWPALPTKIALAATPIINTIADDQTTQGTTYTKAPTLSAGGSVTWSKAYGPDDLTVNATTGAVSWAIPASLPSESFHIGVKATNADGSDTEVWVLTVGSGTVRYVGSSETYTSISAATAASASGDTIIVKDGTYTGTSNAMDNGSIAGRANLPPAGSVGHFTTLLAETPGGVTLDGQGTRNMLYFYGSYADRSGHTPLNSYDTSYIAIKGLVVRGSLDVGAIMTNHVHHVKFIDCGAFDAASASAPISIFRSAYVLVEGCYTWGRGRMSVAFYISDYCILRRTVGRFDYSNASGPVGVLDLYATQHTRGQNCIAIDSIMNNASRESDVGALVNQTGSLTVGDPRIIDVKWEDTIVLNHEGSFTVTQQQPVAGGDVPDFENCVGWNVKLQRSAAGSTEAQSFVNGSDHSIFNQCTFGNVTSPVLAMTAWNSYSVSFNGWTNNQTLTNSLLYNFRDFDNSAADLFYIWETVDHNNINSVGTINVRDSSVTNTITTNPITTNSLKYLPRIESGSSLRTAGASGARVGAEILYWRGKSGTLWGETGYDSMTATPVWPWPHEDLIKTKMAAYASYGVNGARGFAAAGNGLYGGPITLTSYIWEALGNACPSDVCPVASAASLQGDLNGDNTVNIFDYNILLANFGSAQCGNAADIDGNCNVNIFDYNLLLAHFGESI